MLFALWQGPFPPDYIGNEFGVTVSHNDRFTGDDLPDGVNEDVIQRPPRYELRRIVDGMIYLAVVQGFLAVIGLGLLGERNIYLLLIVSGFFGFIYSTFMGLVVGPMMLGMGSLLVLWGALLGWFTTHPLQHPKTSTPAPNILSER